MDRKPTFKVVNVYVTGNTNSGENQVSRQDMLAWFQGCLQLDMKEISELGKGYHYCQMVNLLFPSFNAVPLKNVKFGAKSEHEYTENWKKLQNGFKRLDVDKVIPIERLIKLRMMDNMEFAQWFKKFYDANAGIDDTFGEYDATNERLRCGIAAPSAGPGGKVVTAPRKSPGTNPSAIRGPNPGTRPSGMAGPARGSGAPAKRDPGEAQNGGSVAPRKPAPMQYAPKPQRGGDGDGHGGNQEAVADLKAKLDTANAELELANTKLEETTVNIEGLERERDFYFGKLRDIEILAQEHEESGQLPDENVLKRILDILYATEDGFVAPEEEELLDGAETYPNDEIANEDEETY